MSDPSTPESPATVDPKLTDSVTQVLGDSPALSLSELYQSISQSIALATATAAAAQQQANVISQAATTMGATALHSLGTAAAAAAEAAEPTETPAATEADAPKE